MTFQACTRSWLSSATLLGLVGAACVVAASDTISLTNWQRKQLDESLDRLLPIVTAGMTVEETAEARRVYSDLLRVEIVAFGSHPQISSELFREMISERIARSSGKSLAERRQQMRGDALKARVLTLDRMIVETSERAARGMAVSAAEKARVLEARDELMKLAERMEQEQPALYETMRDRISEGLLDCVYVLDGGDPASFRLSEFVASLPN